MLQDILPVQIPTSLEFFPYMNCEIEVRSLAMQEESSKEYRHAFQLQIIDRLIPPQALYDAQGIHKDV